jgi:hypothetical protein
MDACCADRPCRPVTGYAKSSTNKVRNAPAPSRLPAPSPSLSVTPESCGTHVYWCSHAYYPQTRRPDRAIATTGFWGRVIRAVTKSHYNHTVIRISRSRWPTVLVPITVCVFRDITAFPGVTCGPQFAHDTDGQNRLADVRETELGVRYNYADDLFIGIAQPRARPCVDLAGTGYPTPTRGSAPGWRINTCPCRGGAGICMSSPTTDRMGLSTQDLSCPCFRRSVGSVTILPAVAMF